MEQQQSLKTSFLPYVQTLLLLQSLLILNGTTASNLDNQNRLNYY